MRTRLQLSAAALARDLGDLKERREAEVKLLQDQITLERIQFNGKVRFAGFCPVLTTAQEKTIRQELFESHRRSSELETSHVQALKKYRDEKEAEVTELKGSFKTRELE